TACKSEHPTSSGNFLPIYRNFTINIPMDPAPSRPIPANPTYGAAHRRPSRRVRALDIHRARCKKRERRTEDDYRLKQTRAALKAPAKSATAMRGPAHQVFLRAPEALNSQPRKVCRTGGASPLVSFFRL